MRERVVKNERGRKRRILFPLPRFREVSLSLKFPDLSVLYWASFTRQRGCELACGNGTLDLVYRLQLRQFSDGLKRRPAADWSPAMWRSEVSDVTCHLYGLEELDGKETQMDEENEVRCGQTNRQANNQTDRRANRHTDRQTGKQSDRQAGRPTDRRANRHTDRQTGKQAYRQADGQTIRQTSRQTDRQTGKQAYRQADGQTIRQTSRQTDRHIKWFKWGKLKCSYKYPK